MSDVTDCLTKTALMWYISDITTHFDKLDDKLIKELAEELSEVSLRVPIWFTQSEYKKNTFKKIFEEIKSPYLSASSDNECMIHIVGKVCKTKVTPLYLMALFVFCANKATGDQIEDMEGFDYLKMGKQLQKMDKP